VTAAMPGQRFLPAGLSRPTAGSWRVDPARSQASFAARVAGRPVGGRLPLAGRVLMAEPIEDSTVWLAASTSAISTGAPWLDRLLTGPGFLDACAFPEIGFRSELLAWVPAGWRAVGRLQVKGAEHELACRFDLRPDDLGHRLAVGNPPADSRTRPPHRDDVLSVSRTGHVKCDARRTPPVLSC
jgi:polyisoprenoid-binding protein YceI